MTMADNTKRIKELQDALNGPLDINQRDLLWAELRALLPGANEGVAKGLEGGSPEEVAMLGDPLAAPVAPSIAGPHARALQEFSLESTPERVPSVMGIPARGGDDDREAPDGAKPFDVMLNRANEGARVSQLQASARRGDTEAEKLLKEAHDAEQERIQKTVDEAEKAREDARVAAAEREAKNTEERAKQAAEQAKEEAAEAKKRAAEAKKA
jgi:hypothetical protein